MGSNTVFLKDMPFMLEVGKDAWLREGKVQPVNISLRVNVSSIDEAATSDDVSKCLDYGKLYKDIQWNLKDSKCADVQTLAWQVITSVEAKFTPVTSEITLPKAVRGAEGGIKHILEVKYGTEFDSYQETLHIRDVKCACIIGINQHERRHKQMVVVNATLRAHERTPKWKGEAPDFHRTWIVPEKSSLIIEAIVKVSQ